MPELLLCCALLCSHCRLFCALRCCLLLHQLCFLLKHLRSSAFAPFFSGFCNFRIFHTSLSGIFHSSLSPFFLINLCVFSYYLSFLLPDEAVGGNFVNSTVCCSSVCFSLNYYTSILFVHHKCRDFFSVAHFCAAIVVFFCGLRCCLLLLPLCLLLKHLRSFAFSPFFTGFCHFRIFHTSLSAIFHISLSPSFLHKLMRLLKLSFFSPSWWNLLAKRR